MLRAWTLLALSLALTPQTQGSPVGGNIPDGPPLLWKLLSSALEGVIDPLDRGVPQDACKTFCLLSEPVKRGLSAAACGGAILTQTLTELVCPVSTFRYLKCMYSHTFFVEEYRILR